MRKLATCLPVCLFTFLIGTSTALLWSVNHLSLPKKMAPKRFSELPAVKPSSCEGWHKVEVEGRFSFRLPSYLEDVPFSSNRPATAFRRMGEYRGGLFYVHYSLVKHVSCNGRGHYKYRDTTHSDIMVAGKEAYLVTWIPSLDESTSSDDMPGIGLCVPDMEHGTALHMELYSKDKQGLEVAKQVINSIEFP